MCIIYIPIVLVLYSLFYEVYNNYYAKFIVISRNDNNVLKVHTKPVSLFEAKEIKKKIKTQHYNQTINGFRIKKEIFIVKF